MKFIETEIEGLYVIELEKHADKRGYFARIYCSDEFRKQGLEPEISQCSLSLNEHKGTLRGLHYQVKPYEEVKVVRCLTGKILDAAVDLRPQSKTRGKYFMTELSSENDLALYIPKGFAHGFVTLSDNSLILYQMSAPHNPASARAIRYDDPDISIPWQNYLLGGGGTLIVSDKDRDAPYWRDVQE